MSVDIKLRITPNYFAPKVDLYESDNYPENSHMIVCGPCNFKCHFCDFFDNDNIEFKSLDIELFDKTVRYLMGRGTYFKFTGGEPTLNPNLATMLGIVKRYGGTVFLDSNGSQPKKIRKLVDDGLVDVLGISLKGLSVEEACKTAGVRNAKNAWYNPLKTIEETSRFASHIKLLVTHVFTAPFRMEQIFEFASLLEPFGTSIILKVNNLIPNARNSHLHPVCKNSLEDAVKYLIDVNPNWSGRIVLINSPAAVTMSDEILYY